MVASQDGGNDCGQAKGVTASLAGGAFEQGSSSFDRRHGQQTYPQHRQWIIEVGGCRVDHVSRLSWQESEGAGVDGIYGRWQFTIDL